MTKRKKTSALRQQTRTLQRGALSRSTLFALMGVAALGLIASQARHFGEWSASAQQSFTGWTEHQGFVVQNVSVTGREKVSPQFIMQALQITRGMPILSYDPKSAQSRLTENPWIKSANVERHLPDTIFIRINERKPAARWQLDGKLALIDAEGVALTTDNLEQYQSLPIIIGQNARHKVVDLFTLLKAEPEIGKQVVAATWIGDRRWDLKLKNDMLIRLPAQQPELALSQLAKLNEKQQVLARDLTSIDLRLPHKAVLQPTIRANALIERPTFTDTPDKSKQNI